MTFVQLTPNRIDFHCPPELGVIVYNYPVVPMDNNDTLYARITHTSMMHVYLRRIQN